MRIRPEIIFILLFYFIQHTCVGQKPSDPPTNKEAKDNFNLGNYNSALKEYTDLLKIEPTNPMYNYRAGVCYLNTYLDRSKAIKYLEIAAKSPEYEKEATFDLGKVNQSLYKFDKAIELFKQYKELINNRPAEEVEKADREIEVCVYAKELMKVPLKATFENLGKNVNSEYADYYPFVTGNEEELLFSTRRKGTTGGFQISNDYYTSDIYRSDAKGNNGWGKAKGAGTPFNTAGEDEITSISSDGKYVIIYSETELEVGDIMISIKSGKAYQQRIPLEKPITSESMDAAGCVSLDGNTVVFSSDRSGGEGQFDIYMSKRLPAGNWGDPLNLGPNINTQYIEDFPSLSPDGKTLYFSSQGHVSMGGFDVFRSKWDEEKNEWTKAVNIGYPLNTPDDNMNISFTDDGRHAYLSAFREGGLGDLDIYRVTFDDIEAKYTVIKGIINTEAVQPTSSTITLNSYKKGEVVKEFPTNMSPGIGWEFVETKKKKISADVDVTYTLVYMKAEKKVFLSPENAPKDDPASELIDIKVIEKKKAKPTGVPANIKIPLTPDEITLTNKQTNDVFGNYKTIGETGKYVIIAPPGTYILNIEKEGFQSYSETLVIKDMGIANKEMDKDITLKK